MQNYLKTSCGNCGKSSCNGHCDSLDSGQRCNQHPIQSIEPENNYSVVMTEVFETSGANGCTTSVRCREVSFSLEEFIKYIFKQENPIVNWTVNDDDNDGVYDITVTYWDGTIAPFQIEDTDTRLTNPRPQDTDNNGINDQVLWDVIDDDGNVVGTELVPIQEYVDTNTQSNVTGISYDPNTGILTLNQNQGGTQTTTIPAASGGINLVNNGNPVSLWSTGEDLVSTLPQVYTTNISAHVPATANGLIVRYYVEVDSDVTTTPVEVTLNINGVLVGGTEGGGGLQEVVDNSHWADVFVPYSGVNVTGNLTLNYGADPASYQTKGFLIGYF